MDEQERLRWQLEKVKDSLRVKQLDYENLRESVAELRSTDSRLDSIDEELKAVSQALLAIGEITREIYDESALKLNAFASGIMDEIVGKDFGELYLDQDMEICVRTGEQTLRLSDESYGTLSPGLFRGPNGHRKDAKRPGIYANCSGRYLFHVRSGTASGGLPVA